jgi:hypothetical protein
MTIKNTTQPNVFYPVANATASSNVFVDVFNNRNPTSSDVQYPVQKKWFNTENNSFWILIGFTTNQGIITADWEEISSGSIFETVTGNSGPVVPPTGNNINIVGDGTYITTVGNAGTSTLTIEAAGGLALTYTEDTGTATASAGNLNIVGGAGITTSGSGNTITITSTQAGVAYTSVNHGMSPYTVLTSDYYISVDCSAGVVILNFPNAPVAKQIWIVKDRTGNSATNNISITTPGGTVTFDGQTTYTINTNYKAIELLANATPTYEVF